MIFMLKVVDFVVNTMGFCGQNDRRSAKSGVRMMDCVRKVVDFVLQMVDLSSSPHGTLNAFVMCPCRSGLRQRKWIVCESKPKFSPNTDREWWISGTE